MTDKSAWLYELNASLFLTTNPVEKQGEAVVLHLLHCHYLAYVFLCLFLLYFSRLAPGDPPFSNSRVWKKDTILLPACLPWACFWILPGGKSCLPPVVGFVCMLLVFSRNRLVGATSMKVLVGVDMGLVWWCGGGDAVTLVTPLPPRKCDGGCSHVCTNTNRVCLWAVWDVLW